MHSSKRSLVPPPCYLVKKQISRDKLWLKETGHRIRLKSLESTVHHAGPMPHSLMLPTLSLGNVAPANAYAANAVCVLGLRKRHY